MREYPSCLLFGNPLGFLSKPLEVSFVSNIPVANRRGVGLLPVKKSVWENGSSSFGQFDEIIIPRPEF